MSDGMAAVFVTLAEADAQADCKNCARPIRYYEPVGPGGLVQPHWWHIDTGRITCDLALKAEPAEPE